MAEQPQACWTFEAAVEKAIEMEDSGFRTYLGAIRRLKHKGAGDALRDVALEKLEHKHQLERALILGALEEHVLESPVPTMNLDFFLKAEKLPDDADTREALAYAIHQEKGSVEFYRAMGEKCAGAPMGELFTRMANDETRHLQSLEDLFEEHYLP